MGRNIVHKACFIIKNSAIFAASNDYKFRQNDEEVLSW